MKRTLVPVALAAFVLALTLAPAGAAPRPKTVKVGDYYFAPKSLTVRQGTMVKFKWVVPSDHDVVKAKGPGRDFDSGTKNGVGVRYKHRFKKAGRYKLICSLHGQMKMTLKVKRKRRG
jgi:plastocyanin